ncbi:Low molecular weight phosphotyrosine protein phosphatase [Vermiconidia calcicola]|uniref:Low molecular weight phosphotyrosine protein phosphatase n=1 Tax=Vermiconidia calcicola TaxID=1690605 RepID=A0ACC3N3Q0_9PEZI|nr:Low molecular weight phosphotyrosine protein phosphatase [Vermiconidia calcicola]
MASNTRSQTTTSTSETSTNPPAAKPVSVLFVCLGNICRSPMAEGTFRAVTNFDTDHPHPLISRIDSCGTGAYHAGDQPDPRTLSVLAAKAGITTYRHKARKIKVPSDFLEFDYVLAMDEDNMIDLRDMMKRARKKGVSDAREQEEVMQKVRLYGAFGGKAEDEEVQDPYYGGRNGFEIAYEQVERFGSGLLKHIEQEAAKGAE